MLKYYNPWLRTDKLTNPDKKVYSIKIPHESVMNYKELLKEVETLNPEQPIQDTILPK
jgi:hypothetical protein